MEARGVLDSHGFKDPVIAALVERLQSRFGEDGLLDHELEMSAEATSEAVRARDGSPLTAALRGDRGGNRFSKKMVLRIPALRDVPAGLTHVMINVRSAYFPQHPDWESTVRLCAAGQPEQTRVFQGHYRQHQFFVDISGLLDGGTLTVTALPTVVGDNLPERAVFELEPMLCSKGEIFQRLAQGAVWLFSTARAGSTWLASDLLCAGERARPIDESGLGRMFAPLQWDAERFYNLAQKAALYVESGFDYETGARSRSAAVLPPFERNFKNMRLDNQILSRRNFDMYHRVLRETALEHVVNEWGCLDFSRTVFKCPNDAHAADFIMRAFPESSMVFLMRDGRDVMRSRFSKFGSEELATTKHKGLRRHAIAYYSHWWNFQVDIIAAAYEAHAEERRIFVRFEELRKDAEATVARIFERLGFEITDDDLRALIQSTRLENFSDRGSHKPRQTGAIGGYKAQFDDDEITLMNEIMGPNLRRYGYDVS